MTTRQWSDSKIGSPVSSECQIHSTSQPAERLEFMPTYEPVESVTRAIRLLGRLNQREVSSLADLYQAMQIPKPSLVRLLDTLVSIGYVRHDRARKGYCLTPAVQELSAGFHGGPLLVEAGASCCVALTRRIKWTVSIAVPSGSELVVCFTTLRDSPVSPFGKQLERRRSMLTQAVGQAYIAFCPEAERDILTAMLKSGKTDAECKAIDATVRDLVSRGERYGYIEREPGPVSRMTTTIAMPLFVGGRIVGTIGMTFFASAIRREDLNCAIVKPLRETALAIGRNADRLVRQRPVREMPGRSEAPAATGFASPGAIAAEAVIASPGLPA